MASVLSRHQECLTYFSSFPYSSREAFDALVSSGTANSERQLHWQYGGTQAQRAFPQTSLFLLCFLLSLHLQFRGLSHGDLAGHKH